MRTYDVYRSQEVTACVRVRDSGQIERAYRQALYDWQGFWWSNEEKLLIEELIHDFPHRQELVVSEFKIQRRRNERELIEKESTALIDPSEVEEAAPEEENCKPENTSPA